MTPIATSEASPSEVCLLPVELTDRIIDFLRDHHGALKECALAGRTLLPRCRFHRFHSISLSVQNISQFTTLLQSSPHLSFYVLELRINAKERPPPAGSIKPCISWIESHLSNLGEKLPNVHNLEVYNSRCLRYVAFRGFGSVKTLMLRDCHLKNNNQYIQLLNCFPSLERVYNFSVTIRERDSEITCSEAAFKSLTHLEFVLCDLVSKPLFRWFSQRFLNNIETLTVIPDLLQSYELGPVETLVNVNAGSLKQLRISLPMKGRTRKYMRFPPAYLTVKWSFQQTALILGHSRTLRRSHLKHPHVDPYRSIGYIPYWVA